MVEGSVPGLPTPTPAHSTSSEGAASGILVAAVFPEVLNAEEDRDLPQGRRESL